NDVFKPFFLGEMEVVELTVYNRWGQVVFESNDPNNPGWEGKKDDKDAPSEVYIYTVRVGVGGEVEERTGQVTLLR
uniref:T9SS type B sorting domain-containing protein n=1 Tax=Lewinella sp. TaxID=2004506 RepID=UPI003D6C64D4